MPLPDPPPPPPPPDPVDLWRPPPPPPTAAPERTPRQNALSALRDLAAPEEGEAVSLWGPRVVLVPREGASEEHQPTTRTAAGSDELNLHEDSAPLDRSLYS